MSVRDRKGENRGKISPIIFMCVAGFSRLFTFAVQRRANQLWLACCRAWASCEYPVNIMDIIWTHKTINIRYWLWINCTNSLKRCTFQNELKSSRKGWDGRGQLIWYGTTAVRFHREKLSNSNLGLLINVQKLLNLQQNMQILSKSVPGSI